MIVVKKENKLCPMCMEIHFVFTVKEQENIVFKGVPISYEATYEYCENTDEYSQTEDMLTSNDISMKETYRHIVTRSTTYHRNSCVAGTTK